MLTLQSGKPVPWDKVYKLAKMTQIFDCLDHGTFTSSFCSKIMFLGTRLGYLRKIDLFCFGHVWADAIIVNAIEQVQ